MSRHKGSSYLSESDVSTLGPDGANDRKEITLECNGFNYRVSHAQVIGREKERHVLESAWERVSCGGENELIVVHGESGVGKSRLVESFRSTVETAENQDRVGWFLSAKFDQLSYSRREPFYALVAIISDICEFLSAEWKPEDLEPQLRSHLGYDFDLLVSMIPSMRFLMSQQNNRTQRFATSSFTQIATACKKLLDFASRKRPLLIFLDDVQWADDECLQLIRSFIHDKGSRSILFVVSYRHSDVLTSHAKEALFGEKPQDKAKQQIRTHDLEVRNLDPADVLNFITAVIKLGGQTLFHKIAYEKTQGNAFFLVQFLQLLQAEDLLTFLQYEGKWKLHGTDQEVARMDVSGSVLKSIDTRVHKLPSNVKSVLIVAAHLGFSFRRSVLKRAMFSCDAKTGLHGFDGFKTPHDGDIDDALQLAAEASLIFSSEGGDYVCFMHDRIQQCLFQMVDEGEQKEKLCLAVGNRLKTMSWEDSSLSFLVADILNKGKKQMKDDGEIMELVAINRAAAKVSETRAAYSTVAHYLRAAIDLLDPDTMWSNDYRLTHDLHASLARATSKCGLFVECEAVVEVLLANAKDVFDKQDALVAKINSLEVQGLHQECINVGLSALAELGDPLNAKPSKVGTLLKTMRTREMLKKRSKSDMLRLPRLKDRKWLAVMTIMMNMTVSLIELEMTSLLMARNERLMRYTLLHGLSVASPGAVAFFAGLEVLAFKQVKRGMELAHLSLQMIETYGLEGTECGQVLWIHKAVLPWGQKWALSVEPLNRAYNVGIKNGDTFFACLALGMSIEFLPHVCETLSETEDKIRAVCRCLSQYQQSETTLLWYRCTWQFILNLMGQGDGEPTELEGEVIHEKQVMENHINQIGLDTVYGIAKFELAFHFGQTGTAASYIESIRKLVSGTLLSPLITTFKFMSCLVEIDAAEKQLYNRRTSLSRARQSFKKISKIAQDGCVDAVPLCRILEAEFARLSGDRLQKVMSLYDTGIEQALENGNVMFACIASERAFLAQLAHDLKTQRKFVRTPSWKRMIDLHTRWQAYGKVEWLLNNYGRQEGKSNPIDVVNVPGSRIDVSANLNESSVEHTSCSPAPALSFGSEDHHC